MEQNLICPGQLFFSTIKIGSSSFLFKSLKLAVLLLHSIYFQDWTCLIHTICQRNNIRFCQNNWWWNSKFLGIQFQKKNIGFSFWFPPPPGWGWLTNCLKVPGHISFVCSKSLTYIYPNTPQWKVLSQSLIFYQCCAWEA